MDDHGNPCWYELSTNNLSDAQFFYETIFDWTVISADMPGFDYRLAKVNDTMVAGLMTVPDNVANMPPDWLIYFCVNNCDQFCKEASTKGAVIHRKPTDIPGTGRFAILGDPQGAAFGVLQQDIMNEDNANTGNSNTVVFDQNKAGHANWNELMSSAPEDAYAFYSDLFGWTKGDTIDMGEMGTYQLIRHKDEDIGAIVGLGDAPCPNWTPYFGVNGSVTAKAEKIKASGGSVHHGPTEVPGPAWIAAAQDPQGAWFSIVGPEK